jgi:hypothetical protein
MAFDSVTADMDDRADRGLRDALEEICPTVARDGLKSVGHDPIGGSTSVSVVCAGGAEHQGVNGRQRTNPARYRPGFWKL